MAALRLTEDHREKTKAIQLHLYTWPSSDLDLVIVSFVGLSIII